MMITMMVVQAMSDLSLMGSIRIAYKVTEFEVKLASIWNLGNIDFYMLHLISIAVVMEQGEIDRPPN